MSVNRLKLLFTPLLMVGLMSPVLVNCDIKMPGGLGCAEMDSGDFSQLKFDGGPQVTATIKTFMDASFTFNKIVNDMENDLIASCGALGKDLGMDDAAITAKPDGGKGGEKVCGAVAAKISEMLKANAGVTLAVDIGTPHCVIDLDVVIQCLGTAIKPGELEASCSGGEISGKCDGECKGTCEADASATATATASAACAGSCGGKCDGSCDATFTGTCGGTCKGKCDGKAAKGGKCAGKCEGSCDASASGTCGGTCSGKCDVACKAKAGASATATASAKCSGNCKGGCSGKVTAPKCSGEFKPPSADPKALLACGLKGLAATKCDVPVKITANGAANADITKLVAALQTSFPKIVAIQKGTAQKLVAAGAGVAKAAVDVKGVATAGGLHGGACIVSATAASVSATANIKTNVNASASIGVSVSGSASASGGT